MTILGLEFSSPQRSVAALTASSSRAVVTSREAGRSMRPMDMVEQALRELKLEREQLECVAVGLGPGSYTGIRAAISIAQGWQLARGTRLIGISSADAIAAQAGADGFA